MNKVAAEILQGSTEDRLQAQLKELNTRWTDIPTVLEERCSKLEKGWFWAKFSNEKEKQDEYNSGEILNALIVICAQRLRS